MDGWAGRCSHYSTLPAASCALSVQHICVLELEVFLREARVGCNGVGIPRNPNMKYELQCTLVVHTESVRRERGIYFKMKIYV